MIRQFKIAWLFLVLSVIGIADGQRPVVFSRQFLSVIEMAGTVEVREPFQIEYTQLKKPGQVVYGSLIRIAEASSISIDAMPFSDKASKAIASKLVVKILGPIEFRAESDALHRIGTKTILSHMDLSKFAPGDSDETIIPNWGFNIADLWNLDIGSSIESAPAPTGESSKFGIGKSTKQLRIMSPFDIQVFRSPIVPINIRVGWVDMSKVDLINPKLILRLISLDKDRATEIRPGLKNNIEVRIDHFGKYELVLLDPASGRVSEKIGFEVNQIKPGQAKRADDERRSLVYPPHKTTVINQGRIRFDFSAMTKSAAGSRVFEIYVRMKGEKLPKKHLSTTTTAEITLSKSGEYIWSVRELSTGGSQYDLLVDEQEAKSRTKLIGPYRFRLEKTLPKAPKIDAAISRILTHLDRKKTKERLSHNATIFE